MLSTQVIYKYTNQLFFIYVCLYIIMQGEKKQIVNIHIINKDCKKAISINLNLSLKQTRDTIKRIKVLESTHFVYLTKQQIVIDDEFQGDIQTVDIVNKQNKTILIRVLQTDQQAQSILFNGKSSIQPKKQNTEYSLFKSDRKDQIRNIYSQGRPQSYQQVNKNTNKMKKISQTPVKQFENAKYYGQLVDNKMNGEGRLQLDDGNVYEGNFKDDKFCGDGTMFFKYGGKYKGQWKDNKMEGKGEIIYYNKDKYKGQWKQGKRSGKGIFQTNDGQKYDGSWQNDQAHGNGEYKDREGNVYTGVFKENKRNGDGIFMKINGESYKGQWNNDRMHGEGQYFYVTGDKYYGFFDNNKKNGKGKMQYADETQFDGLWQNDQKKKGKFLNKQGRIVQQYWANGRLTFQQNPKN